MTRCRAVDNSSQSAEGADVTPFTVHVHYSTVHEMSRAGQRHAMMGIDVARN